MTKIELANIIVEFAHWDGIRNPKELCKQCTKAELQDVMNRTEVNKWFCGHMHPEQNFHFQNVCCMYESMMQIV